MGGRLKIFARIFKNFAKYFYSNWNVGKLLFFVIGVKKVAAVNRLRHLDGNWHSRHGFIWRNLFRRNNQHCENYLCRSDNFRNNWTQNFKLTIDKFKTCDKIRQKIFWEVLTLKYICSICGYEYDEEEGDPDNGIDPGTKWEDLPEDFVCPLCGVGKDEFSQAE